MGFSRDYEYQGIRTLLKTIVCTTKMDEKQNKSIVNQNLPYIVTVQSLLTCRFPNTGTATSFRCPKTEVIQNAHCTYSWGSSDSESATEIILWSQQAPFLPLLSKSKSIILLLNNSSTLQNIPSFFTWGTWLAHNWSTHSVNAPRWQ